MGKIVRRALGRSQRWVQFDGDTCGESCVRLFSTRISSVICAAVLCVAVLAAGAPAAHACSCMSSGPACQAFWKTDVAFDGTVLKIEPTSQGIVESGRRFQVTELVVTLQVLQGWKGVDGDTIEVTTSDSGASCGFDFKIGGRYLVFAARGGADPRPRVSLCSFTLNRDQPSDTNPVCGRQPTTVAGTCDDRD